MAEVLLDDFDRLLQVVEGLVEEDVEMQPDDAVERVWIVRKRLSELVDANAEARSRSAWTPQAAMLVFPDVLGIDAQPALDFLARFADICLDLRLELLPLGECIEDDCAAIAEDVRKFGVAISRRIHMYLVIELIIAEPSFVQRAYFGAIQIVPGDIEKRPGGPGLQRLEHLAARLVLDVLQDAEIVAKKIFFDHERGFGDLRRVH